MTKPAPLTKFDEKFKNAQDDWRVCCAKCKQWRVGTLAQLKEPHSCVDEASS